MHHVLHATLGGNAAFNSEAKEADGGRPQVRWKSEKKSERSQPDALDTIRIHVSFDACKVAVAEIIPPSASSFR